MSKSYEELMGAVGRAVFYRPERRRVRDLLSRDACPQLLVGEREFPLFDVSMNGISFLSDNGHTAWQIGQELPLQLRLWDKEIYSGHARVARIEPGPRGGCRVGLGLVTGFLDLPEVRREDDEGQLERDLRSGPEIARARIPAPFRDQVGRAVHFLQYYRQVLGRNEARYRQSVPHAAEAVRSLTERALAALREPWAEIQRGCSHAAVECLQDREVLLAAKEYTETVVTPIMMECPLVQRAYSKPLGYPGDYQVMLYYYNNRPEGDSVYAQVFHKLGVEHPLSAGVRTRRDYVVELMKEEHDRVCAEAGADSSFRVTSLACGPAREVSDYVAGRHGWPGQATFTLIDQEDEALSIAYHDAVRALSRAGARGLGLRRRPARLAGPGDLHADRPGGRGAVDRLPRRGARSLSGRRARLAAVPAPFVRADAARRLHPGVARSAALHLLDRLLRLPARGAGAGRPTRALRAPDARRVAGHRQRPRPERPLLVGRVHPRLDAALSDP